MKLAFPSQNNICVSFVTLVRVLLTVGIMNLVAEATHSEATIYKSVMRFLAAITLITPVADANSLTKAWWNFELCGTMIINDQMTLTAYQR